MTCDTTLGSQPATITPSLSEAEVAAWLAEHPDFFQQQPALLSQMELSHPCGDAESLLLYQLRLLRQQLGSLRTRHDQLLAIARENEQRLKRFERLLIQLVETLNTAELLQVLSEQLQQEFAIPQLRLWGYHQMDTLLQADEARQKAQLNLLGHRAARAFTLQQEHLALLGLDEQVAGGSAVICLLEHEHTAGLLVLAHPEAEHFRHRDTLFIEHLGKVISHLLYRDLRVRTQDEPRPASQSRSPR
ncbi:DUF484 family protein [Marinospirillum sp. MEB164]|uniref:DUF484 family protein n=1 Tax=Marinospirillum alkalitolerans TaxID=3123374 RepID=A0ABW8PW55_9GAMM